MPSTNLVALWEYALEPEKKRNKLQSQQTGPTPDLHEFVAWPKRPGAIATDWNQIANVLPGSKSPYA